MSDQFPKIKYHRITGAVTEIHSPEVEANLGPDWGDENVTPQPAAAPDCPNCEASRAELATARAELASQKAQFDESWKGLQAENDALRASIEAFQQAQYVAPAAAEVVWVSPAVLFPEVVPETPEAPEPVKPRRHR